MPHRNIRNPAELEAWYPFPGYESYFEITRSGRVRSIPRYVNSPAVAGGKRMIRGRELKLQSVKGYPAFLTRGAGRKTTIYVHRAIATLFVPNPDGKPHVNHIDGDKANNDPSNLEWVTHKENMRHAFATGLAHYPKVGSGDKSPTAKLDWPKVRQMRKLLSAGETQLSVARRFGVATGTVGFIARNETWKV